MDRRHVTWVIIGGFLGAIYGVEKYNCSMVLKSID
jgi:hypothetical protein